MAVLDKLKFWKKEEKEPMDFTTDPFADLQQPQQGTDRLGLPLSATGLPEQNAFQQQLAEQEMPSFGRSPPQTEREKPSFSSPTKFGNVEQAAFQSATTSQEIISLQKDIALLSSKLDTIKIMLEHLSHRMENIERLANTQEQPPLRRRGSW